MNSPASSIDTGPPRPWTAIFRKFDMRFNKSIFSDVKYPALLRNTAFFIGELCVGESDELAVRMIASNNSVSTADQASATAGSGNSSKSLFDSSII